jgi:hypothetical protein
MAPRRKSASAIVPDSIEREAQLDMAAPAGAFVYEPLVAQLPSVMVEEAAADLTTQGTVETDVLSAPVSDLRPEMGLLSSPPLAVASGTGVVRIVSHQFTDFVT